MDQHCCDMMSQNVNHRCDEHPSPFDCPDNLIYTTEDGRYGIIIHDGGQSFIEIQFCPWCGDRITYSTPDA